MTDSKSHPIDSPKPCHYVSVISTHGAQLRRCHERPHIFGEDLVTCCVCGDVRGERERGSPWSV
ncbi:MAG: hypothetical protein QGH33_15430, partial [Pirellulaceae bacterium]|nr:hypothetical protein [Pirellulaceae bacterium]